MVGGGPSSAPRLASPRRLRQWLWPWLLILLALGTACVQGPSQTIDAFELDAGRQGQSVQSVQSVQTIELPAWFEDQVEPRTRYTLRAHVSLPPELRGQALDLSIPLLQAQLEVEADGERLHPDQRYAGYRVAHPRRWRVPARLSEDGELELALRIEHGWSQSAWLTNKPMLLPAGAPDPRARTIEAVNIRGSWLAVGLLTQIGLTCLLIYSLDRRRRPYMWFGIQALSATVYPAFTSGLTTWLGPLDTVLVELGLLAALTASLFFTHTHFDPSCLRTAGLSEPPRWLLGLLALAAVVAVLVPGPFVATTISAPAVVVAVAVTSVYQMVILVRLWRRGEVERHGDVGLLLAAWVGLSLGTWADLSCWLGFVDPLGGVRPAGLGLAAFALFLSLLLSRSHIRSLRESDALNVELGEQLEALELERSRTAALNEDLRAQIADRSAQLFTALALVEGAENSRQILLPGTEVNERYRIERVLGSGAMGMVYEVARLSDESRWAMKIASESSGTTLARLAREAHIASKIVDPNVVRVRDIDVSTQGFMYVILELVEGESLRKRLARGVLPAKEATSVLAQVARGLVALHAASVAHRDLKPENILLRTTEESAERGQAHAKIADFGISRLGTSELPELRRPAGTSSPDADTARELADPDPLEPDAAADGSEPADESEEATMSETSSPASSGGSLSSSLSLTRTGVLAGTPHYIAPELALGAPTTTLASDMFSFGVVAFETLAGIRPFAVPVALSLRRGESADLLDMSPLIVRDVDEALAQLIEGCLALDPEARPSAREAARVLETLAEAQAKDDGALSAAG
ncbi:protein kinase domain-containing protein [Plesiocystis pacifica]|uniref:protein kinase domain-containing protein n=1 Tax=Plesiocystis pacifica TaxID=191768 RepID=UPI000A312EBD|nr:protein kinase [Plesiocystis pacifica]